MRDRRAVLVPGCTDAWHASLGDLSVQSGPELVPLIAVEVPPCDRCRVDLDRVQSMGALDQARTDALVEFRTSIGCANAWATCAGTLPANINAGMLVQFSGLLFQRVELWARVLNNGPELKVSVTILADRRAGVGTGEQLADPMLGVLV